MDLRFPRLFVLCCGLGARLGGDGFEAGDLWVTVQRHEEYIPAQTALPSIRHFQNWLRACEGRVALVNNLRYSLQVSNTGPEFRLERAGESIHVVPNDPEALGGDGYDNPERYQPLPTLVVSGTVKEWRDWMRVAGFEEGPGCVRVTDGNTIGAAGSSTHQLVVLGGWNQGKAWPEGVSDKEGITRAIVGFARRAASAGEGTYHYIPETWVRGLADRARPVILPPAEVPVIAGRVLRKGRKLEL